MTSLPDPLNAVRLLRLGHAFGHEDFFVSYLGMSDGSSPTSITNTVTNVIGSNIPIGVRYINTNTIGRTVGTITVTHNFLVPANFSISYTPIFSSVLVGKRSHATVHLSVCIRRVGQTTVSGIIVSSIGPITWTDRLRTYDACTPHQCRH